MTSRFYDHGPASSTSARNPARSRSSRACTSASSDTNAIASSRLSTVSFAPGDSIANDRRTRSSSWDSTSVTLSNLRSFYPLGRGALAVGATAGLDGRRVVLEHPEVEFFPSRGQSTAEAKALYGRCLGQRECRDFALADPDLVGVWGGTSPRERARLWRMTHLSDAA